MTELRFTPRGPFSLAASIRFLEGWPPAAYRGGDRLRLAFPVERDWRTVGVSLREEDGDVVATVVGDADPGLVRGQVERILSLDVDGGGFAAVGERDPVVAELQHRYPGLRPVAFCSPYEAAAWAVLSHRIRMTQAAVLKQRIAELLGEQVVVDGEPLSGFPPPDALRGLTELQGLTERKVTYLHGIAEAAEEGVLDAERLRGLDREDALAQLQQLPGIGPFSADLVLLRGAGDPDGFPGTEGRLAQAIRDHYGPDADPEEIAEGWRPYRTWVALLLRVDLEASPA